MASTLVSDGRSIVMASEMNSDGAKFRVGAFGLVRIEAYDEEGGLGWEPWLAVYYEGEFQPRYRVAARYFLIGYEPA